MYRILDSVRYGAAGGILASAVANIAGSPSDRANVIIGITAFVLTIVLVKARHLVD